MEKLDVPRRCWRQYRTSCLESRRLCAAALTPEERRSGRRTWTCYRREDSSRTGPASGSAWAADLAAGSAVSASDRWPPPTHLRRRPCPSPPRRSPPPEWCWRAARDSVCGLPGGPRRRRRRWASWRQDGLRPGRCRTTSRPLNADHR